MTANIQLTSPFKWLSDRAVPYLPYAGVAAGAVSGLAGRYLSSDWDKSFPSCIKGFIGSSILQTINEWKHWEVTTNNFLFCPRNFLFLKDLILPDYEVDGVLDRIQKAFGKISKEEIVAASVLIAGNCLWYGGALDLIVDEDAMDMSGHVMVKMGLAYLNSKTLQAAMEQGASKASALALFTLTALTDAVLLHNTARYCHSATEIAVGAATAAIFLKAGDYLTDLEQEKTRLHTL